MAYHLGVDLGTTFTAAAASSGGAPSMVGLGNRALQIPSVLYLHPDGSVLVGEAAELRSGSDPARSVREFKRRIGDPVPILVGGRPFSAQALSARLLRWVVDKSTEQLGEPPLDVTLTYPANWAQFKVDLLRQVAVLADLESVRACSEPEAAALQYASRAHVAPGDRIAVYDLGGGTFDVCVLEKTDIGFRILGRPEGIEHLGGIDFDEALFRRVVEQLPAAALEAESDDDAGQLAALGRLRRDCVEAKEALSTDVEAVVPVVLPQLQTSVRLTRGEFEDIIRPALEDTIGATRRALRSAAIDPAQLRALVLVGGSSRIPLIAELLGNTFRCPIAVDTHPKNDVAAGAARAGALPQGAMTLVSPTERAAPLTGRMTGPVHPDSVTRPGVAVDQGRIPVPPPVIAGVMTPPAGGAGMRPPGGGSRPPAGGSRPPGGGSVPPPGISAGPGGPTHPQQPDHGPAGDPARQAGTAPAGSAQSPSTTGRIAGDAAARRRRIVLIAVATVVLLAGVGTVVALRSGGDAGSGAASASPSSSPSASAGPSSPGSSASAAPSTAAASSGGPASGTIAPTAGLSPTGLPAAAPLPDNSLVIAREVDGNVDLYVVDIATGAVGTRLTSEPDPQRAPSLSPDRGTVIYADQVGTARSLRVIATNGAGDRALFEAPPEGCDRVNRAAWNPVRPDELALVCLDGSGSYSLQVVTVDGTSIRTLDTGQQRVDDVSYSPDGTTVAFWGSAGSLFDGGSIYRMPVDGSAAPTPVTTQAVGSDADPAWSPDGSQIAFRRRLPGATPQGNLDIFVMAADGGAVAQLTTDAGNDQDPSWSPDGQSLAFTSDRNDAAGSRLWVMRADGSDQRQVPPDGDGEAADEQAPAWSRR
jgi:molecular chaperone DnaK